MEKPIADEHGVTDFTAVERIVSAFHQTVVRGEPRLLAPLLFPFWRRKWVGKNGAISIQISDELTSSGSSGQPEFAANPHFSSIQLCFGDFAIVRADAWVTRATDFHLLFKQQGTWRIAGTVSLDAASGRHDEAYATRPEEAAVLAVLGAYYQAVTAGDGRTIERIFAPMWEMKNHQDGIVAVEDKQSFADRIHARPVPGYNEDRQIADVQIIADRLAYVRIDKPSVPVSTVFFLLKSAEGWSIIDKAWSAGDKV